MWGFAVNRFCLLATVRLRSLHLRQRIVIGATALLLMLLVAPLASTAADTTSNPIVPAQSPNSVVPAPFNSNMSWSQEGGWHWVTLSYVGANTTDGQAISPAYFVASLVKTLQAKDQCGDCVKINDHEQGPPTIFGGAKDPTIGAAYQDLDNGPRTRNADGSWPAGSWFLNYSPTSKRFFSWTWIPGYVASKAEGGPLSEGVSATSAATLGFISTQAGAGGRVFPLAGGYTISQGFGCVPENPGYPTSPSCPPDKPSFHDGVDLAAPLGTPIVAAASGTVVFAGMSSNQPGANSQIVIQHDGANAGYQTMYLHWEKSFVKVGDHVAAGQEIALIGSVGYSTGPHLHFTVLDKAGNALDPLGWLKGSTVPVIGTGTISVAATTGVLQWKQLMQAAAQQYNVPIAFIAAIMTVESGGNPNAISAAGAQGLMQVMPDELTSMGVAQGKWLDPVSNIAAGAQYIAQRILGGLSLSDVAASYFGQGCDAYGTCTDQYVAKVMSWYSYYTNLFSGQPAIPPTTLPSLTQATTDQGIPDAQSQIVQAPQTQQSAPKKETTPKATPTPKPTPKPSPTPSASHTPSSATAPTAAPTTTPKPTATPSPTPTPSSSPTPSPAANPTPTTNTSTSTSDHGKATPTPTATPTETVTPSPTASPSPTTVPTVTPSPSPTPSPTATSTPSSQSSSSSTPGDVGSSKSSQSGSGSTGAPGDVGRSPTPTPTPTETPTPTPTVKPTP